MKNIFTHKKISVFFLPVLLFFVFTACDNSVGNDDHDHDHDSDPYGVLLLMDGVEIVKQEGSDLVYANDSHIEVVEGEESNQILVEWLDDHGESFHPHAEDGYSLNWDIKNDDILSVEQHSSDGPWSFHFIGNAAGETTISIMLWHGDHDHFTSQEFDVKVVPSGAS